MDADRFLRDAAEVISREALKEVSRETFGVCANSAETLAIKVESGELPMDAADACRLLAHMYRASAGRLV